MVTNTARAVKAPFAVPDVEDRTASVVKVVRALLEADIRGDDRRYFLDLALWRLTEFDKNRYKFAVRFRTPDVLGPDVYDINHEHVVPRQWLVDQVLSRPADAERYLCLAAACVVTKPEHARLQSAHGFGWERYIAAGVRVIDTADMTELDLRAAAAAQLAVLEELESKQVG
jgi:hypothetical protein